MNLPSPTFLAVSFAALAASCSDPPAPPAQGAVAESISSTPGMACQATTAEFTAPALIDPVNGTHASLFCDLSSGTGCKPNANVVVDGDNGAQVHCTVTGAGNVTANLAFSDVAFSVQG